MHTANGIQWHLATILTLTACLAAILFAWNGPTASAVDADEMGLALEPFADDLPGQYFADASFTEQEPQDQQPNGRMIGGQIAPPKQFPSFVSMRIFELGIPHFCTGTILNRNWILTAAICVGERTNISRIVLVMGTVRMQDIGQRHHIDRVIRHPQFTGRSSDFLAHNIALIKTRKPIQMTQRVQAIELFVNDVIDVGHLGLVGGWREVCYIFQIIDVVLLSAFVLFGWMMLN